MSDTSRSAGILIWQRDSGKLNSRYWSAKVNQTCLESNTKFMACLSLVVSKQVQTTLVNLNPSSFTPWETILEIFHLLSLISLSSLSTNSDIARTDPGRRLEGSLRVRNQIGKFCGEKSSKNLSTRCLLGLFILSF